MPHTPNPSHDSWPRQFDVEKRDSWPRHFTRSFSDDDIDLEKKKEPIRIGWDGPNDPKNPRNWSERKKWANIIVLSVVTTVT